VVGEEVVARVPGPEVGVGRLGEAAAKREKEREREKCEGKKKEKNNK